MKNIFKLILASALMLTCCFVSCSTSNDDDNESSAKKTLVAIVVTSQPTAATYAKGSPEPTWANNGLQITAVYSDGDTPLLAASDYTVSGWNSSLAKKITLTVSYTSANVTKTTTFSVTITANGTEPTEPDNTAVALASLAVTTPPATTSYAVGSTFSSAGLVVTATYADSSTKKLSENEYKLSTPDMATAGTKTVIISYTSGGVTKTASFEITVSASSSTTDALIAIGETVTFPSGTAAATITDTILALTSETTLKLNGAINAVMLKAIADAMKENDSVLISLDLSETTGITEMKEWFAEINTLYAISLPKTTITVKSGAFYSCNQLTAITIPPTVKEIEPCYKTAYATGGLEIVLPEKAFYTTKLKSVNYTGSFSDWCATTWADNLPDDAALYIDGINVKELTEITIPASVTSISEYTFSNWKFKSVIYEGTLADWCTVSLNKNIAADVAIFINGTNMKEATELIIPSSVTSIADYAFYNWTALKTVTISDNVTRIESYAFSGCSALEKLNFGTGIMYIGSYAFENCKLYSIYSLEGTATFADAERTWYYRSDEYDFDTYLCKVSDAEQIKYLMKILVSENFSKYIFFTDKYKAE